MAVTFGGRFCHEAQEKGKKSPNRVVLVRYLCFLPNLFLHGVSSLMSGIYMNYSMLQLRLLSQFEDIDLSSNIHVQAISLGGDSGAIVGTRL